MPRFEREVKDTKWTLKVKSKINQIMPWLNKKKINRQQTILIVCGVN